MIKSHTEWSIKSKELAVELHSELRINEQDWHRKKVNPNFRAAELLSAAVVQLLNNGEISDIEDLADLAVQWLKGEIKDPGCPRH